MRLRRLTLRGFGLFREEVALDLDALPGPLVAVVGENGAGKSTLLEAWPGALYRRTPTRGALADLALDRGAFVEVEIAGPGGAAWTIRQTVDAVSVKGEALVLAADGRPVVSGRKRCEEWVRARLPSPEVFYASVFGVQGAGGFLAATPGERKAILLRALGCERLEALAERCRKHAAETRSRLATAGARLRDERARSGDPAAAEAVLEAARVEAARAEGALEEGPRLRRVA